ncbi:MAG: MBL fold metallo-hydrolase [Verrucomicrobiota bacterium]
MEIIVMGCGTSQGVPLVAHDNPGIDLQDERNWRSRTSIHVVIEGHHVQVDAAPEFRMQCLNNDIQAVDTFILTHGHADHVLGMDDLRQFCTNKGGAPIPVFTTPIGIERVRAIYPYAIGRPAASGYVALDLDLMPRRLVLPGGGIVSSTILPHGQESTLGLVFEEPSTGAKFTYYTDCKSVPPEALELGKNAHLAILDGLRPNYHPTHMSIDEACAVSVELGAKRSLITHMTYQIDYAIYTEKLRSTFPKVGLCYDGLRITLE